MQTLREDDPRWAAIVGRDSTADGLFWYAVRTTGVYCRPSCALRWPNRANVVVFDATEAAERKGFRACKRCRPDRPPGTLGANDPVVLACLRIEASLIAPTLEALATTAGLSPSHLHRRFQSSLGVTPRAYASAVKLGKLAMNQDRDLKTKVGPVRHACSPCPFGWVLVAATDRGVCWIELGDDPDALHGRIAARFPNAEPASDEVGLAPTLAAILAYLDTPARGLDFPLDIQGTAFQARVWQALRAIPPGSTATYAEIARRIDRPTAARAVARVCASNPIALAIPCHRVIRGDGQLGGFRWGVERKRMLLDHEADRLDDPIDFRQNGSQFTGAGPIDLESLGIAQHHSSEDVR